MRILTGLTLAELRRGTRADIYAAVDEVIPRTTRQGEPFVILRVSDRTAHGTIYSFADQQAYTAAGSARRGDVVKVRVVVDRADDTLAMKGLELRVEPAPPAAAAAAIFGPLHPDAHDVARGDVGFDLETTPRLELTALPPRERDKFHRAAVADARRETGADVPDSDAIAASANKLLALHPLTTRIVSIGLHSLETGAELALVAPGDMAIELPGLALDEDELLRTFWALARRVRTLIGFNSRRFDVPVLLARSALLGVRAPVDLQSARYDRDARHVDIYDVLQARGAAGDRRLSLELAAFAFGIPVKSTGHGSEVAEFVAEGRLQDLVTYNLEDARATAQIYTKLVGTWL